MVVIRRYNLDTYLLYCALNIARPGSLMFPSECYETNEIRYRAKTCPQLVPTKLEIDQQRPCGLPPS